MLPPLFLSLLVLFSLFPRTHQITTTATPNKKKVLTTHGISLTYTGSLDPNLVHSHNVKMRWSKARHGPTYDPADPRAVDDDDNEEDMKKRPTLSYILTTALAEETFKSLVEKLPPNETKAIVEWRRLDSKGAFDFVPKCTSFGWEEKSDDDNDKDNDNNMVDDFPANLGSQICTISLPTLYDTHGIQFTLSSTITTAPMTDLTPSQISSRITPDKRGSTEPITHTYVRVTIQMQSPNWDGGGKNKHGNRPHGMETRKNEEKEVVKNNVERTAERIVRKCQRMYVVSYGQLDIKELDSELVEIGGVALPPSPEDNPGEDKVTMDRMSLLREMIEKEEKEEELSTSIDPYSEEEEHEALMQRLNDAVKLLEQEEKDRIRRERMERDVELDMLEFEMRDALGKSMAGIGSDENLEDALRQQKEEVWEWENEIAKMVDGMILPPVEEFEKMLPDGYDEL